MAAAVKPAAAKPAAAAAAAKFERKATTVMLTDLLMRNPAHNFAIQIVSASTNDDSVFPVVSYGLAPSADKLLSGLINGREGLGDVAVRKNGKCCSVRLYWADLDLMVTAVALARDKHSIDWTQEQIRKKCG